MRKLLLALALCIPSLAWGLISVTSVPDGAYAVLNTDQYLIPAAISAPRTWTLPLSTKSINNGPIEFYDAAKTVTATNTITFSATSPDSINGAASLTFSTPGVTAFFLPVTSGWYAYSVGSAVVGTVSSTYVTAASAVALTTATAKTVTSVPLTAGDWDCRGALTRKLASPTSVTQLKTSISTTTNTSGSLDTGTMVQTVYGVASPIVLGADTTIVIGPIQQQTTGGTAYLVAEDTFATSTNAGYGQLVCRKVR